MQVPGTLMDTESPASHRIPKAPSCTWRKSGPMRRRPWSPGGVLFEVQHVEVLSWQRPYAGIGYVPVFVGIGKGLHPCLCFNPCVYSWRRLHVLSLAERVLALVSQIGVRLSRERRAICRHPITELEPFSTQLNNAWRNQRPTGRYLMIVC